MKYIFLFLSFGLAVIAFTLSESTKMTVKNATNQPITLEGRWHNDKGEIVFLAVNQEVQFELPGESSVQLEATFPDGRLINAAYYYTNGVDLMVAVMHDEFVMK